MAGADRYGVQAGGTMAHAFVQAHEVEIDAFRAFASAFGDATVLLVDTYDTRRGIERAIRVAGEMRERGTELRGVRLDSGDLAAHARLARRSLYAAGFHDVQILVSGGLDGYEIHRHVHVELTDPDQHVIRISARLRRTADEIDAHHGKPRMRAIDTVLFDSHTAPAVIDVQNDFADPRGSLYVDGGECVVLPVNHLVHAARDAGSLVVYTRAWHPRPRRTPTRWAASGLFIASRAPGARSSTRISMSKGQSCEKARTKRTGTPDSPPRRRHRRRQANRPRCLPARPRRSSHRRSRARRGRLRHEDGLDARRLGYDTTVVTQATRPVNRDSGAEGPAIEAMAAAGVHIC